MARTIKLLLYYIAYQLAFAGTATVGYMLCNGLSNVPTIADGHFLKLSIAAGALGTLGMGLHLILGKYVTCEKGTRLTVSLLGTAVLFIVGMGCWTNYLSEILQLPNNSEQLFEAMMRDPIGIISIVILAPVVEELLFRGGIQGHLTRTWKNPAWGIGFASLVFGVIHGNPVQIPFAFLTGLALGWVYYRTGSLTPCILMHFVNNASSVLLYHLTGDADATLQGLLGAEGAFALAIGGLAVSGLCAWMVWKLTDSPAA